MPLKSKVSVHGHGAVSLFFYPSASFTLSPSCHKYKRNIPLLILNCYYNERCSTQ